MEQYFLPGARAGTYWDFVASWWPLRDDPNVLTLAYEEALAAPRAAIERVAAFMGIDADAHLLDVTLEPEDDFLILCCDGIWDVLSNEECLDFVRKFCGADRS